MLSARTCLNAKSQLGVFKLTLKASSIVSASTSSATLRTVVMPSISNLQQYNNYSTSPKPAPKLTLDDVNENILKAKYAVRGRIPMRAEELKAQLKKDPASLPFKKIINANIGNPQQLDQKPLTFYREVLSLLQHPELLDEADETLLSLYKIDSIQRARRLLEEVGGSVGAYSQSQGVQGIRETVASFITNRDDGEIAYPEDIFLTAGASAAVSYILSMLCKGPSTGVLNCQRYNVYAMLREDEL